MNAIPLHLAAPALGWRWWAALAMLALPWLNPYVQGPSAAMALWLGAATFVVGLGLLWAPVDVQPISLYLLGAAVMLLARSGWGLEPLAFAAACVLVCYVSATVASQRESNQAVTAIAWAVMLASLGSTFLAMVQYFGVAQTLAPLVAQSPAGDAYANLRQRNQFASLTVMGIAATVWLNRDHRPTWAALTAVAFLAAGNAATTSRTGMMQLLAFGLLALVWRPSARGHLSLCATAIGAYGIALIALPSTAESLVGGDRAHLWARVADAPACTSRRVLWSNVLHLIAQKPWLGWGWGELDYAHYSTLYPGERFCEIMDNAHNLPLHIAVELGVPAALLLCAAVLWAVIRARPWRETDPTRQLAWSVLMVIGIHSLLEYPLWYAPFQMALGICIGLLWPAPEAADKPSSGAWGKLIPLSLIAALAFAAWDYRRVSQIYLAYEQRAAYWRDDALEQARRSWLFLSYASFAEVTLTPVTRKNAEWMLATGERVLHYSPEPRVIEKVIEAATILGRDDVALWHLARFRAAYPAAYAAWSRRARAT